MSLQALYPVAGKLPNSNNFQRVWQSFRNLHDIREENSQDPSRDAILDAVRGDDISWDSSDSPRPEPETDAMWQYYLQGPRPSVLDEPFSSSSDQLSAPSADPPAYTSGAGPSTSAAHAALHALHVSDSPTLDDPLKLLSIQEPSPGSDKTATTHDDE